MAARIKWVRIPAEVYHTIYNSLDPLLSVYCTRMGDDEESRWMDTEGGFKDAPPVGLSYFIACVQVHEESVD